MRGEAMLNEDHDYRSIPPSLILIFFDFIAIRYAIAFTPYRYCRHITPLRFIDIFNTPLRYAAIAITPRHAAALYYYAIFTIRFTLMATMP